MKDTDELIVTSCGDGWALVEHEDTNWYVRQIKIAGISLEPGYSGNKFKIQADTWAVENGDTSPALLVESAGWYTPE